jgi:hypothetical protein
VDVVAAHRLRLHPETDLRRIERGERREGVAVLVLVADEVLHGRAGVHPAQLLVERVHLGRIEAAGVHAREEAHAIEAELVAALAQELALVLVEQAVGQAGLDRGPPERLDLGELARVGELSLELDQPRRGRGARGVVVEEAEERRGRRRRRGDPVPAAGLPAGAELRERPLRRLGRRRDRPGRRRLEVVAPALGRVLHGHLIEGGRQALRGRAPRVDRRRAGQAGARLRKFC